MVMGVCLCRFFFKYECSMGHLFVLSWGRVRRVALGRNLQFIYIYPNIIKPD